MSRFLPLRFLCDIVSEKTLEEIISVNVHV